MKATIRGAVLLFAVTAFLLAAAGEEVNLFRLAGLAVLFFAAYRYNLAVAGGEKSAEPGGGGRKIAIACVLLLLFNLLPAARGADAALRDNLALLLVAVAFFATRPLVREYGFLVAWGAFNIWLFLTPQFSFVLAPLFIIAAVHYRCAITAYGLGEEYGCPEHGDTPVARRITAAWMLLALLLFVPLQLWGWWEDQRLRPPLTTEDRAAQQAMLEQTQKQFPLRVSVLGLGALLLAFVLWRQLRQQNKRGKSDRELQTMLSAQGFTRPLDEPAAARFSFPGGTRGQVLKLYERLLAATEKKLKKNLRCLTPAQREEQFRKLDGARSWGEVTAIYNRARYSEGEISAAEVATVKQQVRG